MKLHDTALGRAVELELRDPGRLSIYCCGPTVYDVTHIGHGRGYIVWDVFRRYLEWTGIDVRFVSNITDIDDNIINRANAEARSAEDVAKQYEGVFYEAMDALGVKRPDEDPHATAYVDDMVGLVSTLVDRGHAYERSTGVYLAVDTVPGYGLLARQPLDSLRSGARIDVDEEKRSPLDFALWKKAKPGEPSWPSPWGEGRPGWHTECVVMSLDLLGDGFDLHTGGEDLAFPHHENERAQAVALGRDFARRWDHHAHLLVGGQKMSKSLKNYVTVPDLVASRDPRAFRLLVLEAGYRRPMDVTDAGLDAAERAVASLDAFARRTEELPAAAADSDVLDRFRAAMDDDFDTPAAMAHLFEIVRTANAALDAGDADAAAAMAAAVAEMATAVGLEVRSGKADLDADTADLVRRRDEARSARDFAAADAIRDDLIARGWLVEDTAQGTRVSRR